MPVIQEISENGHLICYRITDPWQIEQLTGYFPEDILYRNAAPYKVHTIVDVRQMRTVPSGALETRNAPALIHPNHGEFIVVGMVPRVYRVLRIILRLARSERHWTFDTEAEALTFLRNVIAAESNSNNA